MVPDRQQMRLLCWEGYDTESFLKPFESANHVDVHAETLLSDADTARRLADGEHDQWDVLNINNAYVRNFLHPRGLIAELDPERFGSQLECLLPQFRRLYRWMYSDRGALIGICQRFGAFNFVVNTRRISRASAEDQGFDLANDPAVRGRFGILTYEDFNIFHICIGTGLNPFVVLTDDEEVRFERTANNWFTAASLVSDDHHCLNRALVDGQIDFYLSGGVYTASPARLAGHHEIRAVTPRRGPMDGRGGIVFTEITSVLDHGSTSPFAPAFLEYQLSPEAARRIAFAEGTCNPVAQMGGPAVFNAFSRAQLDTIQWDSLEEDIDRCADYDLVPNHATLLPRMRAAMAARPEYASNE